MKAEGPFPFGSGFGAVNRVAPMVTVVSSAFLAPWFRLPAISSPNS